LLTMRTSLLPAEDTNPQPSLCAYLQGGGYQAWAQVRNTASPERLLQAIENAGLTGKGGAGFSTCRKMRLMRGQPGAQKYLVINGSEHEPGSLKDRFLMENHPHKVLEGALILAFSVQANKIIVAINETAAGPIDRFRSALQEVQGDATIDLAGIEVSVQTVPDIYIVGEESALLEVLQGGKPLPRKKPPFPIEQGLNGFPTLINNVETAAHLPLVVTAGANAYRALGRNGKGVTLCTLGSEFLRPGIYEIPIGTPIREVLDVCGGGLRDRSKVKAVQPGGPSSGLLDSSQFELALDDEVLREHGSALGCAAIRAYSQNDCMVREIGQILQFFSHGCCGQCPRCRMETNMLDAIVKQVLAGRGNWKLIEQVDRIIELARGEGICSLITMPVAPLKSGLRLFRNEFAAHIEGLCRLCAAGTSDPRIERLAQV
jgi:NADH:ubiquinone oxidoreductase subunit F (NADH-binding)